MTSPSMTSLLVIASLHFVLVTNAQGQTQQPAGLTCYACTYRTVAGAVVGKYCSDPFITPTVSANITCDSACVKRIYSGGVEEIKRKCYSDVKEGPTCENYYDKEVPNSDPPQTVTQLCCRDSLCNHGNVHMSGFCLLVIAAFGALFLKYFD